MSRLEAGRRHNVRFTLNGKACGGEAEPRYVTRIDPSSNTIVIVDTRANLRRVLDIVSNMDKRDPADSDILVKTLKYADAASAALQQDSIVQNGRTLRVGLSWKFWAK